jgi:hypothetical protein
MFQDFVLIRPKSVAKKFLLLNRTAHLREDRARVRPNQPDRSHNHDQNDRQHHRVLRYVLSFYIRPKYFYKAVHNFSLGYAEAVVVALLIGCGLELNPHASLSCAKAFRPT